MINHGNKKEKNMFIEKFNTILSIIQNEAQIQASWASKATSLMIDIEQISLMRKK